MNRTLRTYGTINLAFISLESEGKERVGLKKVFYLLLLLLLLILFYF